MLALGTAAPDFSLPDVRSGATVSLADFREKPALLVMFLCNHCPYVQHMSAELARLGRDYAGRAGIVAISSNDPEDYPDDSPRRLAGFAENAGFSFPLLFDESQAVAKLYTAACTPDFFLFDAERRLAYRGQLDSTRPGKGTPDGRDLRAALDALLAGRPVSADQKPSIGCNIKWRAGNAPDYFSAKK